MLCIWCLVCNRVENLQISDLGVSQPHMTIPSFGLAHCILCMWVLRIYLVISSCLTDAVIKIKIHSFQQTLSHWLNVYHLRLRRTGLSSLEVRESVPSLSEFHSQGRYLPTILLLLQELPKEIVGLSTTRKIPRNKDAHTNEKT